uniref:uncharacterized protein n=1 Tax=Semicossyphus pulcher TaxID=241346 RepID=UPI0037E9A4DC
MEAVLGLLLLLGASHGVETFCDGRQDGAQCYGALGGGVDVQLMDSTSEIFRYQWKKGSTSILHGRKNRIVSNLIESRSSFTPSNGTFRINDLSRNDSGEYTLEIYDDSGTNPVKRTLQLTIQEVQSYLLIMAGVLSALVILLVVGLAIVWAGKKKRNKPKEGEEDDQDLTYADVRIMQQQGRQAQPRAEMEVEYGQVKFSERPPRAVEPAGDECVYAKVRKGR